MLGAIQRRRRQGTTDIVGNTIPPRPIRISKGKAAYRDAPSLAQRNIFYQTCYISSSRLVEKVAVMVLAEP